MDSTKIMENIIIPTIWLFSLLLILPPFIAYKIVNYVLRSCFPENVAGKIVLITGASAGIGEQLAYEYAKRGACLALASRRRDKLEAVAKTARQLGSPDVIIETADVSRIEDCRRFIGAAASHFGRVDHLVNNAGILQVSMLQDVDNFENFASIMDVNFWGSVYCTRFAIPYLRESKGKIAVISSAAAWCPIPRFSIYSASKGAIVSFFESLRTEVGSDIGITIVMPGVVDSDMGRNEASKKGGLELAPKQSAEECAKGILSNICRNDRFLFDFKIIYLWKLLCPEIIDSFSRWLLITRPSPSQISSKSD